MLSQQQLAYQLALIEFQQNILMGMMFRILFQLEINNYLLSKHYSNDPKTTEANATVKETKTGYIPNQRRAYQYW